MTHARTHKFLAHDACDIPFNARPCLPRTQQSIHPAIVVDMDNASGKRISNTRPTLTPSTDKTQSTLFVTNRSIRANDTKIHTHRSHESPSSFPYRYHRPFRSAFASHAHARTLPAPRHVRRVIGLLLARRATRRRYVQQKRYVFVCLFFFNLMRRARVRDAFADRERRARRVIFRDAWRARERRRRGFASRMGPRGTRTMTIRVTNGCDVMRVVYRRCVVGAVIVAYRVGEGRCRRRWRVEGFRS